MKIEFAGPSNKTNHGALYTLLIHDEQGGFICHALELALLVKPQFMWMTWRGRKYGLSGFYITFAFLWLGVVMNFGARTRRRNPTRDSGQDSAWEAA